MTDLTNHVTLTDAERERLTGIFKWHANAAENVVLAVEAIVAARVAEALNQAADEVERHTTHGTHAHTFWEAGRFLRALAEGAGS